MNNLQPIVANIMKNNFSLDKSASILVLTDRSTENLALYFKKALATEGWNVSFYCMEDRTKSGEEPPEEAANKMKNYNIAFCLTKHSITHTVARKNANANGVSVITMPGITEDMLLEGAMSADYGVVEKETNKVAEKLTDHNQITIYTGEEYQLTIPIDKRDGVASTGVFRGEAASGNLPSGEAFIAPVEDGANGQILINGSIAGIGLLDESVILTIKKGRLIDASGSVGKQLMELLGGGNGRILGELGIGTNYAARLTGKILEDEKAYNTIHVAFGSNHTFGGVVEADVHIDCVTKNPMLSWTQARHESITREMSCFEAKVSWYESIGTAVDGSYKH